MSKVLSISLLIFFLGSCRTESNKIPNLNNEIIIQVMNQITDVMVHDVTSPPLAARFYAYACLAGYEVVSQNNSEYRSMKGLLNGYPTFIKPADIKTKSYQLSAVLAILATAKMIQPSGKLLQSFEDHLLDSCRTLGFSQKTIEQSKHYADIISKQIIAYAKSDNYNRISNYPRYTPNEGEGKWYPTPPGFFAPVEPYFNTVRPFSLDTCNQFQPKPPVEFSKNKKSAFFLLMQQNYKKQLSKREETIAAFWDCNPFALNDNGHMLIGMKKISPGAHWIGITGIACKNSQIDFAKALKIHTVIAIGLMDAFICCWDEKFRSNRIRPETAIRTYIDPTWKSFLQTPPFPEYVSGHSTISATSSVILTYYFGKHFAYTDNIEERFGLDSRKYNSFNEAAYEAGMSRFYGGIHFMDAITNGQEQGQKVGTWILKTIELKK